MVDIPEGTVKQHPNGGTYARQGGVWVLQGSAPAVAAPAPPSGVLGRIAGAPKPAPVQAPERPGQAELRELQIVNARLDAEAQSIANDKARAEGGPGAADAKATAKSSDLDALVGQINRVESLYGQSLKGSPQTLGALNEYLPTATNRTFDAAASGMAEQGLAAFRVLGSGAQSDTELRQFVQANKPSASNYDEEVEEKLRQLRARVDATRAALGLPAAQWEGLPGQEDGEAAPVEVEIVGGGVGDPNAPIAPAGGPTIGQSIPAQLGESTANAVAAVGQGLAGIPDAFFNATGAVLGAGADALGFDNVARDLRNPTTIGGLIEKAIPTPQDGVGRGVRLVGQLGGGIAGFPQKAANALASNIVGRVPQGFTGGGPASRIASEGREVVEAGARQRVPIRQPDARPGVRGDFAAVAQSPTGGPRIGNALSADRELVGQRVSGLANGQARDPYALGNQIQGAMTRQGTRTKNEATALYNRVDRAAPGHVADATPVLGAIDEKIATLSAEGATANAAEIKVLQGIKDDFAQSGISVKSLQTQRRGMRQRLKDNGIDVSSTDASYMNILDEAGKTLESSLKANPKALSSLKTANAQWAERAKFRQEVAKQFMGGRNSPIKPETAAARFVSMTKQGGDYNRFSRGFKELEQAERDDFASTIAEGMGKVKSGDFSYGQFVKDLEDMNPRAVRDLFGPRGQEALNDLRVISKAKSETAGAMNHSNTGGVMSRTNGFRDLVMTAFGGGVAGVPGAMVGAVSRSALERFSSARQARMLLDPTFTKWLKRMPDSTNPKVIDQHFAKLNSVAANSPALLADAKALQAFLTEALEQSPGRLAAGQDERNRR